MVRLSTLAPEALVSYVLPVPGHVKRVWERLPRDGCVPPVCCLPVEDDLFLSAGTILAQLEMYGGAGLGGNAGGVRCANVGDFQIKGIGATALAGRGTDKWHRHGALSLQDAVKETVMGALFAAAAPHGAVVGHGIVDLGVSFATEIGEDKLPGSAPRALLYRDLSVRVAHFMRSSFMDVGPDLAQRELLRMRNGIPRFVNWLCRDLGEPSFERAAQGLSLVFELLMHQVAVLRTKRLVHGSLIPSNFCIDGRLLDFTTSTAVSTLQPVMVSLGGLTSQQQHEQVLEALPDVLFYIAKYDGRCSASRAQLQQMADFLLTRLTASHHDHLMQEHLALFGFSTAELAGLGRSVKQALASSLVRAIACGSVRGHLYFGGDEHPMLPQEGADDLFSLISFAIAQASGLRIKATENYAPTPEAFPVSVVADLVAAFGAAACELGVPEPKDPARGLAWLIRAMQRNADLTPLFRRHLDGAINEVCVGGGDFGAFIEQALLDWTNVFDCPADGQTKLGGWLTQEPVVLSADGCLHGPGPLPSPLALAQMDQARRIRPRHRWLFDVAAANALH